MRMPQPEEPSIPRAFFCAPLVTPILAIVSTALLPGVYSTELDILIALPIIVVLSLIYGYLGMLLVCLPIMMLLRRIGRLNLILLCFLTAIGGATIWAIWCAYGWGPAFSPARQFVLGFICSLGTSALFCFLGGITVRSS